MFYSRQLLARKASLGQIWMAATMKWKINRKDLAKININKICEEIMNPSVPMALRLSGILMGGVVIVYERKVKLLYDDVNRFLVELNQAWKVRGVADPTLLPKGKTQAKYKSITLPEKRDHDLGEFEESLPFTDEAPIMMGFAQTDYITVSLDNLDDQYVNPNPQEDDPQAHQADFADITITDLPDFTVDDISIYNRFERFDNPGDEDTHCNFTSQDHNPNPSTLVPSPPPQEKPVEENMEEHPMDQVNMHAAPDVEVPQQYQVRQGGNRRRARRTASLALDDDQSIIPSHIYQSWLQDCSDITTRKRNKRTLDAMNKRKIGNLMELPPTVLVEGLHRYGLEEVHFPAPLMELWKKSTQPLHGSHFGTTATCQHSAPSTTAPSEEMHDQVPIQFPFEGLHTGVDPVPEGISIEKERTIDNHNTLVSENIDMGLSEAYGLNFNTTNPMATPGNSGDDVSSIPSSGSGQGFHSHNSDSNSSRRNTKRSNPLNYGLEPVDEENSWQHPDPNLKLPRLYEEESPLLETGPTQTQNHPIIDQPADPIANSLRMQLKAHFETPGSPKVVSLNKLAHGMDRKKAASLFFQTCVLATEDSIRVEQKMPYGDILISRGAKM